MKAIQLTEEHKSKLLEMCSSLFPEMGSVQFGVKEKHGWSSDYLVFGIEKSDDDTFVIHWFEFCMIHLPERLSILSYEILKEKSWEKIPSYVSNIYPNTKGKWTLYTKFHFHYPKACNGNNIKIPSNPIDFLYDEFKKIKT